MSDFRLARTLQADLRARMNDKVLKSVPPVANLVDRMEQAFGSEDVGTPPCKGCPMCRRCATQLLACRQFFNYADLGQGKGRPWSGHRPTRRWFVKTFAPEREKRISKIDREVNDNAERYARSAKASAKRLEKETEKYQKRIRQAAANQRIAERVAAWLRVP